MAAQYLADAEAYAFYDAGRLWSAGSFPPAGNLQSAGAGVRVRLASRFTVQLEAAVPVQCPGSDRNCDRTRGIFALSGKF